MPQTNPDAWLHHELPQRLLIEQIVTDFASDSNIYSKDTNLATAACREQVREWSELQSIHELKWSLSAEDDEHPAQQIVHQQSAAFTYKVLERDAWPVTRSSALASRGPTVPPPKLQCLKSRAHRLDSIVRHVGPITKHRIITIPQATWPAFGTNYCQTCTNTENIPAFFNPGFKASQSRNARI